MKVFKEIIISFNIPNSGELMYYGVRDTLTKLLIKNKTVAQNLYLNLILMD